MRADDLNPHGHNEERPDEALGDDRSDALTQDVQQHLKNMQIGVGLARSNQIEAFTDFLPYDPAALPVRRSTPGEPPSGACAVVGDLGRGKTFSLDDLGGSAGQGPSDGTTTEKGG